MRFLTFGCTAGIDGRCGKYEPREYVGAFERLRALGVRVVEISHLFSLEPHNGAPLRRAAQDLGLTIRSGHCRPLERGEEIVRHDARVLAELGGQVLVMHPAYRADGSYDAPGIARAVEIAAAEGLTAALETGILPPGGLPQSYAALFALADDVGAKINVDVGHSFMRDDPRVENVVSAAGARLTTLHCHDNFGLHDDHQAPGLGKVDWAGVLRALRASPYEGPFMMEMTDGLKEQRTDPGMRDIDLDREVAMAMGYIQSLWNQI